MGFIADLFADGVAGGTPLTAAKLNNLEQGELNADVTNPASAAAIAIRATITAQAEPIGLSGTTNAALSNTFATRAEGGYILATFRASSGSVGGDQLLHIAYSQDGTVFDDSAYGAVYQPANFPTNLVRDPSIVWREDQQAFFIAHTDTGATGTTFSLIKSATLLPGSFTLIKQFDVSAIGGVTATWAPEFIEDGTDVYIVFSVNMQKPYWVKATAANLTTWTTPALLTVTGGPTNIIDPAFIKYGTSWVMVGVDKDSLTGGTPSLFRATSTTGVVGTYAVDRTAASNWLALGNVYYEGPSLVRMANGTYRLYLDKAAATTDLGYYFLTSTDLSTWTTVQGIIRTPGDVPYKYRHGTVLAITAKTANRLGPVKLISTSPRFVGPQPDTNQSTPAGVYPSTSVDGSGNSFPNILLANGSVAWRVSMTSGGDLTIDRPGIGGMPLRIQASDSLFVFGGTFSLPNATTQTTSPSAGAGGTLPATPAGYVTMNIAGLARKVPYY